MKALNQLVSFVKRDKKPLTIAAVVGAVWGVILWNFSEVNFGVYGLLALVCIPAAIATVTSIRSMIK